VRIAAGTDVQFVNDDDMPHNLTGRGIYEDLTRRGEIATVHFGTAGTFAYACTIHPGMTGAIVVGDGHFTETSERPVALALPTTTEALAQEETATNTANENSGAQLSWVAALALAAIVGIAGLLGGHQLSQASRRREVTATAERAFSAR
jgi:hypothetical protein